MRPFLIPFCLFSMLAAFHLGCEPAATLKPVSPPDSPPTETVESKPNFTTSSKEADMNSSAHVVREKLDAEHQGRPLEQFVITNKHGLRVVVLNLGAIIASVETPDRNGKLDNIVCGFSPDNAMFLKNPPYFGACCGRYGNRIAKGKFTLDGHEYELATNNGPNHLHGGLIGFDKVIWDAEPVSRDGAAGVKLTYLSRDGEEGFPGNLTSLVTYLLTDDNQLRLEYTATTDKATPLNLTNHAYWNLKGARPESGLILDHIVKLNCDRFIPVDVGGIPIGELASVKDGPMDFTQAKAIGKDIGTLTNDPQGFDHCWVIKGADGKTPVLAAEVKEPSTGRVMRVLTTEPGIQFYTGNYLNGSSEVGGFAKHGGFCLETQKFPDSPNQPSFPNCILRPGETYSQTTIHEFSIE